MAAKTAQRTKVQTKQAGPALVTTQKTSLELLQTTVDASIGCITYLRGLFPDTCYVEERFIAEQTSPRASGKHNKGQKVMRLKRHVSTEVDRMLDYLDKGVFVALSAGHLAAVMLSIGVDESDPASVLECYTFHFAYAEGDVPTLLVRDGKSSRDTGPLPITSARRTIQQLFRQLIVLTQSLSPLPLKRAKLLNLRLFYTESAPVDYEPPGFRPLLETELATFYTRHDHERPQDQAIGSLNTGLHKCTLRVAALNESAVASSQSQDSNSGSQRKAWAAEHFARLAAKGLIDEKQDDTLHDLPPSLGLPTFPQTPTGGLTSQQATTFPSSSVQERAKDIPETLVIDDSATPPTDLVPASQIVTRSQHRKATHISPSIEESSLAMSAPMQDDHKPQTADGLGEGEIVRCECGDTLEDGDMVCCDECGLWQHVPCYGFWKGVPKNYNHECYSCRFGGGVSTTAETRLDEFRSLCLFRRALHSIWHEGYTYASVRGFAKKLGCDSATATGVLNRLVAEGWAKYVAATTTSATKRKGAATTHAATYEAIKSTSNRRRLVKKIFDPSYGLSDEDGDHGGSVLTQQSSVEVFKPSSLTPPPKKDTTRRKKQPVEVDLTPAAEKLSVAEVRGRKRSWEDQEVDRDEILDNDDDDETVDLNATRDGSPLLIISDSIHTTSPPDVHASRPPSFATAILPDRTEDCVPSTPLRRSKRVKASIIERPIHARGQTSTSTTSHPGSRSDA